MRNDALLSRIIQQDSFGNRRDILGCCVPSPCPVHSVRKTLLGCCVPCPCPVHVKLAKRIGRSNSFAEISSTAAPGCLQLPAGLTVFVCAVQHALVDLQIGREYICHDICSRQVEERVHASLIDRSDPIIPEMLLTFLLASN